MEDKKLIKKEYVFGEIKEYDLEKIETEVLKDSVYLDVFAGSDLAFKEECTELNSSTTLEKLSHLQAYNFKYKASEFPEHSFPQGEQFGFMAQDVEKQFPQLIKKDSSGHSFVNYQQMIPILAETIKNLNERILILEKSLNER